MKYNLYTIDWTAIGSIVTLMALIVAYWNIYQSDKQNKANSKLQLSLLKHGVEQNRLDELIESIMIIYTAMKPIIVVDYSLKFLRSYFTENDRHFINEMAAKDEYYNNLLHIRLIKYGNKESAKNILIELMSIRKVFGEWVQILSKLNINRQENMYDPESLLKDISVMNTRIGEIIPQYKETAQEIVNSNNNVYDKAVDLMQLYYYAVNQFLLSKKVSFERELSKFVTEEQKKIDDIINLKKKDDKRRFYKEIPRYKGSAV